MTLAPISIQATVSDYSAIITLSTAGMKEPSFSGAFSLLAEKSFPLLLANQHYYSEHGNSTYPGVLESIVSFSKRSLHLINGYMHLIEVEDKTKYESSL